MASPQRMKSDDVLASFIIPSDGRQAKNKAPGVEDPVREELAYGLTAGSLGIEWR